MMNVLATFIGKRERDTLPAPFWKWVSMEHEEFLAFIMRNQWVMWPLLSIYDVLTKFVGYNAHELLVAAL